MTRLQLQQIPVYQTAAIAAAAEENPKTHAYIIESLTRLYAGDYGMIGEEDTGYNNSELEAGEGHVLGKYAAAAGLADDIYINILFSESEPGADYNYGMIMYCSEY